VAFLISFYRAVSKFWICLGAESGNNLSLFPINISNKAKICSEITVRGIVCFAGFSLVIRKLSTAIG